MTCWPPRNSSNSQNRATSTLRSASRPKPITHTSFAEVNPIKRAFYSNLFRRGSQLLTDPVLRRWCVRRLTGRTRGPAKFIAHRPPYLAGIAGPDGETPDPPELFSALDGNDRKDAIRLPLPGLRLALEPGQQKGVFDTSFDDIETLLALHRFAWLPLVEDDSKTWWAQVLWEEWRARFAVPDDGWAWHPYTAAERAVNLLDLARESGLPQPVPDTVDLLAGHAGAIHRQLEYFGEHDTSNHLANNGRGLYRLGLALGMDGTAEIGARILEEEAKRLFMASGMLREGSSHYHLLVARNYADAWLAARRHNRSEEPVLRDIARQAVGVVPWLMLPGGMPLVGDISPDCPAEHLLGLTGAEIGWVGRLPGDDRRALLDLIAETPATDEAAVRRDGWLRFGLGPWTGLWHATPLGWPPAPGHGHQDIGSFELHFSDVPVIVDPGRGRYGETREAAMYRSSEVHSSILVGGQAPFPANKPYYDDTFRREITGPLPALSSGDDEVTLSHHGFRRLSGVGPAHRQWRFEDKRMVLTDRLDGTGRHRITRLLVTPLTAEASAGGVSLKGGGMVVHVHAPDAVVALRPMTLWRAYGEGRPGSMIAFDVEAVLPWSGELRMQVL